MPFQKIGSIKRTYRHVRRYRQIIATFLKYGFEDFVRNSRLKPLVRRRSGPNDEALHPNNRPERVRMALEELGPTFVKFGQVMSTHHEILPEEYIAELEKLQDKVPPFEYEEVVAIIERELERPLAELFETFEPIPAAAASIGQVHRARLPGGEEVVVKVQRPNIRNLVEVDLDIMHYIAELSERHMENWRTQRPTRLVEEFARVIRKEIDYTVEASHLKQFALQFQDEPNMYVPRVYDDYSTSRVLTMEYIVGVKPSDAEVLRANGLDPCEVARRGFDLLLKQIFQHGFFHADPHPANYLILPDNVICYLDFGMMGRLVKSERERFADLVHAVAEQNEQKAANAAMNLTEWDEEPDREKLQRELNDFISQHLNKPLKEVRLGRLLHDLINILAEFRMRLPRDLLLVVKAFTTMEGIGRALDPEFDPVRQAEPFLKRMKRKRLTPERIARETYEGASNLFWLLLDLPEEIRKILGQLRRGQVKVDVEVKGFDPLRQTLDRVSNRVSLSILVGALVVGSSIMVHSGIPPKWREIPLIGVVGFLLAGFICIFLIISIIRERKQ